MIDKNVLNILVKAWEKTKNYEPHLEIFLKAIIVLCVRSYSNFVHSRSHPNWIKIGGRPEALNLKELILSKINVYLNYYKDVFSVHFNRKRIGRCQFYCIDSAKLSFQKKFDVIFTSPSYRNSTDLYNMYSPELKFLEQVGYGVESSNFLGTNIVKDYDEKAFSKDLKYIEQVSPITRDFINKVYIVQAETSNYYPRVFTRHYSRLFSSIQKILTFLKPTGVAYFVVQTNFHRGNQNDMRKFLLDFFSYLKWESETVSEEYHNHNGKRNYSKKYPGVLDKVPEYIIRISR